MRRNVLNITASDVKDAKLTATVTIPAADVDAAIKKAYKDTAKKYRFPWVSAPVRPPSRSSTLLLAPRLPSPRPPMT